MEMNERQQKELLEWSEVAIMELEKLKDDRTARILKNGGKALIAEIKKKNKE